jgi:deacetoxycephalosporin-C synthase/deacetoxycephalosporin-C hydroxylase
MTETRIDIFDPDELRNGLRLDEFRASLFDRGVFYLREDDVIGSEHRKAMNAVMDLFERSTPEQRSALKNPLPNIRRGLSDLESESTARITNGGEYTDYSMCYSIGLSDNLFPSKEFEGIWTSYFDRFYLLGKDIARSVLVAADAKLDESMDTFLECDPLLRFRYFPEVPEDRCAEMEPRRMAPHYDLSIITIIQQTPCANGFVSLQCEIDGRYVDLPPIPGCMVVFCGAVAPLVSNGRIKAPRHQVASPSSDQRVGSSRTSSVFFLRPRPDFRFSVPLAKSCGLDVDFTGETATFGNWIGSNYVNLRSAAVDQPATEPA